MLASQMAANASAHAFNGSREEEEEEEEEEEGDTSSYAARSPGQPNGTKDRTHTPPEQKCGNYSFESPLCSRISAEIQ